MKGWVYVISNLSMPNLLKVGFTMKDPEGRARELDSTGMPHPYIVEYAVLIDKPDLVERAVHASLKEFHENKEWFRCSVETASSIVFEAAEGGLQTHGHTRKSEVIRHPKKQMPSMRMESYICSVCRTKYETLSTLNKAHPRCSNCVLASWRAEH